MEMASDIVILLFFRVLPFAIGTYCAVYGVWAAFLALRFVFRANSTPGTVVGYQTEGEKMEGEYYSPVMEFTDQDGCHHRVTSRSGNGAKLYKVGSCVTVLYDPAIPDRAEIRAFRTLWFLPLVLLVFAGIFLAAGLGLFFK